MGMSKIVAMPRRDGKWAESEIRRILSLGHHRVIIGTHTKERMLERGFSRADLFRALERGHVMDDPEKTALPNEWKCKVVYNLKENRDCGVVTIIQEKDSLFVKTIEWEDLR